MAWMPCGLPALCMDAIFQRRPYSSHMSYQVLARRWRPRRFSDLVGQDVVVRTLKNALASGKLAHAYLLTGIRGVGKTTIARLLAMAVNCEQREDGEPCGECVSCQAISSGSSLDVQEMDAASHTKVEEMRDILETVRYPSAGLKCKVYIIDEAHMLSRSAFNALLKTLEEPPERVMFVLATTEVDRLPVTVRSRCQRFDLRRLGADEIGAYLRTVLRQEKIDCEEEGINEIARAAGGSVRDALTLTERVMAFTGTGITAEDVRTALGIMDWDHVLALSDAIFSGDARAALACFRAAVSSAYAPASLLASLGELWHQLACNMVDSEMLESGHNSEVRAWLNRWTDAWEAQALDLRYQVLMHGLRDLSLVDEYMGAEMLVMRLSGLQQISRPKKKLTEITTDAEIKEQDAAVDGRADVPHDKLADEPVLPLDSEQEPRKGFSCWEDAVRAYADIRPGVAAMLEHVLCEDFGTKVRLALDTHQQQAIAQSDRLAFAEWLGREVHWEPRADQEGETLSEVKARQATQLHQQLWQAAESEPHVGLLIRELGAKLVDVRPPGTEETTAQK